MPMYDFECPKGHKTEHFLSKYADNTECGYVQGKRKPCKEVADHRPTFWYTSALGRKAQGFVPVVIHVDAEGNVRLPAHKDAPMPPGFKKVELSDITAIRKFENKMNKVERGKMEDHQRNQTRSMNAQFAENRGAMAEMVKRFSPKGQKFYEAMRAVSEKKQAEFAKRGIKDPNFHIEAFSQDATNREAYSDARNDWGKHHGSGK